MNVFLAISAGVLASLCLILIPVPRVYAQSGSPPASQQASPIASRAQALGVQAPEWLPLPPDHAKYLDDVLTYWEFKSGKVARYRCQFERWEYDPVAVQNANVPKTLAKGVIKYAAPDKGLFQVGELRQLVLPLQNGVEPTYEPVKDILGEHWVCDGASIFEFDARNKQLKQRELPPDVQGKQIVEGPLPFMFGAKAETIKQRYWIRVIVPPPRKNAYWLEAVPRTQEDAADFKLLHIILAEEDYLPEGIVLYHRNSARTVFQFAQREVNWNDLIDRINLFHREFFEPATPPGWKRVVEPFSTSPTVPVAGLPATSDVLQSQRPRAALPR